MNLSSSLLVRLNRKHFKYEAPDEDPVAYARWEFQEGRRVWQRFFESRVDLKGKDVLDLGCGPGGKTCFLAAKGAHRVLGVDVSAEMVRQAERARELLPPPEDRVKLDFACVDAADLPFPDAYFDVITCSDAFEHFADPHAILAQAGRILKPGGLFALDFAQWGAYNGHHLGDFFATPWAHVFWSDQAIEDAVRQIAEAEKSKLMDPAARKNVDDLVERRLEHFRTGLNRLRLETFERYLKEETRFKMKWRRRTAAHPVIWPLIFVPGIRELAVARNVYLLERVP